MNLYHQWKESLRNLGSSKLRSFLALLGILVGTGSVVALVSSSQLATEHALAQFKTLGTNLLAVSIEPDQNESEGQQKNLSLNDIPTINTSNPNITHTAPYTSLYESLSYKGNMLSGQIIGATSELPTVIRLKLKSGRFISDLDHYSLFCVIGQKLAQTLRANGAKKVIGQLISTGKQVFTVIGVLDTWPQNMFVYTDINNSMIIPIKLSFILSKYAKIDNVLFRLKEKVDLQSVQGNLQKTLTSILPGSHFNFRNPKQLLTVMRKQHSTFTDLLGMIGGIALVVGGIGVMNIMLVSVTERRREIGIRMAIGAKRSDIRWMFLIESITLTIVGGLIGIAIGTLITWILAKSSGWQYHFFMTPAALGFSTSIAVGIAAGIYPAFRASKLDPVSCLQSE